MQCTCTFHSRNRKSGTRREMNWSAFVLVPGMSTGWCCRIFSSVHSTLHFSLFLRQWQTRHNVSTSDTDKDTLLSHLCSSSITERNDSPISSLSNEEKGQKVCYSSTYKYIHMSIYHHEKNLGFYSCTLEDTIP